MVVDHSEHEPDEDRDPDHERGQVGRLLPRGPHDLLQLRPDLGQELADPATLVSDVRAKGRP